MNSMKLLITRLRSLQPRPPSRRVRERLFGGRTRPGAGRFAAVLPLAATAACSLWLAFWSGPERWSRDAGRGEGIWAGTNPVSAVSSPVGHTVRNVVPARLEWTNPGPPLSSMPSLPLGWTNRTR